MRMSSLGATSAQPATTTAGGDLMRGFSSLSNRVRWSFATTQAESTTDSGKLQPYSSLTGCEKVVSVASALTT